MILDFLPNNLVRNLPLEIIFTYCIFATFTTQQKFHWREFVGSTTGYYVILEYFIIISHLFGVGFLIFYGIKASWLAAIVLYALGCFSYIRYLNFVLLVEKFVPIFVWSFLSFIVVPICGAFLIVNTPDSDVFKFHRIDKMDKSDFPNKSHEEVNIEFSYDLILTHSKEDDSIYYTYKEKVRYSPKTLGFSVDSIILLDKKNNPIGGFKPKKFASSSYNSNGFEVYNGKLMTDESDAKLNRLTLENTRKLGEMFSISQHDR